MGDICGMKARSDSSSIICINFCSLKLFSKSSQLSKRSLPTHTTMRTTTIPVLTNVIFSFSRNVTLGPVYLIANYIESCRNMYLFVYLCICTCTFVCVSLVHQQDISLLTVVSITKVLWSHDGIFFSLFENVPPCENR